MSAVITLSTRALLLGVALCAALAVVANLVDLPAWLTYGLFVVIVAVGVAVTVRDTRVADTGRASRRPRSATR